MDLKLTFQLTFHSDYHVGSGHRAGPLVDSALLRDYDQAPLLRGTVLAGLLRDGLEDLLALPAARGLDTADAKVRLFGSPARRKRWAYSSARPVGSEASKPGRWGAQDAMRVRVNPRTRRADPQKLFKQEEGDARLAFQFTATCHGATAKDLRDAALLVAAARMVRHIGSARRRGRGECSITLVHAEGGAFPAPQPPVTWTDAALAEFKTRWLDGLPPQVQTTAREKANSPAFSLDGPRKRFEVIARLEEPLIIARRSEAANAYESLETIPGTTVLGALADRAACQLDLEPGQEPNDDFVTLFFRGGVRVSGLLPAKRVSDTLYPAIPAPQALFTCENFPAFRESPHHGVHNYAVKTELPGKCGVEEAGVKCQAKLEPLKGLLTLKRAPEQLDLAKREEAHIRMYRESGRAKTGDLFEYIAVEAGQWFVGELECANEKCWQRLTEWTGIAANTIQTLHLGKASRRGYGLTRFIVQPLEDQAPSPWTLLPLSERVTSSDEPLTITLLTDTIIPDPWQRFRAGFDETWIAEMLGLQSDQMELLGNFAGTRSVDSFNTYRRNARWRDEAIAAGSAAGFKVKTNGLESLRTQWQKEHPSQSEADALTALRWKLGQIEEKGIGLRCHEGFGRVAFNHPIYEPLKLEGRDIDLPQALKPVLQQHPLEDEFLFRQEWGDELDKEKWESITDKFEPVARMLFLSRKEPVEVIKRRFHNLGKPEYLWNKSISAREKEPKIESAGLALIERWVDELARWPNLTEFKWAIGLEMIAERVAIAALRKQGGSR